MTEEYDSIYEDEFLKYYESVVYPMDKESIDNLINLGVHTKSSILNIYYNEWIYKKNGPKKWNELSEDELPLSEKINKRIESAYRQGQLETLTLAVEGLLNIGYPIEKAKEILKMDDNDLIEVKEFTKRNVSVEFLSVRDVSRLTGQTPPIVRRHCVSGKYEAEQIVGEWRIKPEQFMQLSNWGSFLKERECEIENSKKIVDHALALWEGEGPLDIGSN